MIRFFSNGRGYQGAAPENCGGNDDARREFRPSVVCHNATADANANDGYAETDQVLGAKIHLVPF